MKFIQKNQKKKKKLGKIENKQEQKQGKETIETKDIDIIMDTSKNSVTTKKKNYKSIEEKLIKAEELFNQFENSKNEKEKYNLIKEVINICEINSKYNYNYLDLCKKYDSKSYKKECINLANALNKDDYSNLFKVEPQNPATSIYDLIKLFIFDKKIFQKEIKNINIIEYNIPLIKSTERLRVHYYKQLFRNPTTKLIGGIDSFKNIINKMENLFKNIELDKIDFDNQLFLFLLYLSEIIYNCKYKQYILNYYIHKFNPSSFTIKNSSIFKKEKNRLYIYNSFEKIAINKDDYVLENVYLEYCNNKDYIPLEILLQRNISFNYFNKNKNDINIINNKELYKEFKDYFKLFIKSNLVKEVLDLFDSNIKNIIEKDIFSGNLLDEEYVKPLPININAIEGITNKDIVVSFISTSPFILNILDEITNKNDYKNLKNLHYVFNIGGKFIIVIHEIIHLNYGFLHYLTDREYKADSPKSNSKKEKNEINGPNKDGASFFEKLLFGKKIKKLNLQNIITLLDSNNLNKSISEFQKEFNSKLNLESFKKKMQSKKIGPFLKKILEKYPLDLKNDNLEKASINMRKEESSEIMISLEREIPDSFSMSKYLKLE